MNADEQKLQKQTQVVRPRRSVLDYADKNSKKLLQPPASLEITRLTDKWTAGPLYVGEGDLSGVGEDGKRFFGICDRQTIQANSQQHCTLSRYIR